MTRLNACLLVGTEDEIPVFQGGAFPLPRVQVEDRPCLFQELGVSREDPVLVLPRLDGIFVEDAPHRATADRPIQRSLRSRCEIRQRLPTDGLARLGNPLTGQRLEQSMIARGKKRPCGRGLLHPPTRNLLQTTAYATDELAARRALHDAQVVPDPNLDAHEPVAPAETAERNVAMPSSDAPPLVPSPRSALETTGRKPVVGQP